MRRRIVLLGVAALSAFFLSVGASWNAGAQTQFGGQQACPPIFANDGLTTIGYGDFEEIFDDVHSIARNTGNLCGMEIWLTNLDVNNNVTAEISLYENDDFNSPPQSRIAGPFSVNLPPGHDGPVQINPSGAQIQRHMWVGVRFQKIYPDSASGVVRLTTGPARVGESQDVLFAGSSGQYVPLSSFQADFYMTIFSDAETNERNATWGEVKSDYR